MEIIKLEDRNYSPRGWQYKKYGNTNQGKIALIKLLNSGVEIISDTCSERSKNDYNSTFDRTIKLIKDGVEITVNVYPSRSKSSCLYVFNIDGELKDYIIK